jgi:DNA-binding PadR family transcriptional regulator
LPQTNSSREKIIPIEKTEEFWQETRKKIINAYLALIVLATLSQTSITSGTEIISLVKKRYDVQLSPGTVYPVLYRLEKLRNIERLPRRMKKIYVLTPVGKQTLQDSQKQLNDIAMLAQSNF